MDAQIPALLQTSRSLKDLLAFERFVVVGANSGGDQVQQWLNAHGKQVMAFTDLAESAHGTSRNGLNVLAPAACLPMADARTAFAIGTVRQREAATLLIHDLGISPMRVFPFINPMFAAHFGDGVQDALAHAHGRIRTALADEESCAYFDRVTAFYRTMDSRHLAPQPKRIGQYGYDAPGCNPRRGAESVDCGAFVGDSFADFLTATNRNCRIYALEAFLPNFTRMMETIAREKIAGIVKPLHVAAAGTSGALIMSGNDQIADGCAHTGDGGGSVDIVLGETLDNLFLRHMPAKIDYLKMDIEGADLDALKGGRALLQACRPVVAVAAYHKPGHIIEIADFLQQTLAPCRLYAAHDPDWVFHIHYIAVPDERAL